MSLFILRERSSAERQTTALTQHEPDFPYAIEVTTALLAALTIAVPAVAFAHNGATGIVGERMMAMMMLSEQVKALTPAVETGAATQAQVDAAARMILMHSGTAMTSSSPKAVPMPSQKRSPPSGSVGTTSHRVQTNSRRLPSNC